MNTPSGRASRRRRCCPCVANWALDSYPSVPLGRGFLSGVVKETEKLEQNDVRRRLPRFQEENLKQNIVLVQRLEAMARSKGCSPPQLALAWLLAKGDRIVPIPGTKRRRYLEENVGAMEIALSGEDLAALDEAFPSESVAGERYPPESMRLIEGNEPDTRTSQV